MSLSPSDLSLLDQGITSLVSNFTKGVENAFTLGPDAMQWIRSYAEAFEEVNWWPCDWNPSTVFNFNQALDNEAAEKEAAEDALDEMPEGNLQRAMEIGHSFNQWPEESPQLVLSLDLVHVFPWQDFLRLLQAVGNKLAVGGVFICIGPFKKHGGFSSAAEMAWDASLKRMNSQLGIRDMQEVLRAAEGLRLACWHESYLGGNRQALVLRRMS